MKTTKAYHPRGKASRRRSSQRYPRWMIAAIVWAVVASVIAAYALCSMHGSAIWAFVTVTVRIVFELRRSIFEAVLDTSSSLGAIRTTKAYYPRAAARLRRSSQRYPRWMIAIIVWAMIASVIAVYGICSLHGSAIWAFVTATARVVFEFRKSLFEAALETWCYVIRILNRKK